MFHLLVLVLASRPAGLSTRPAPSILRSPFQHFPSRAPLRNRSWRNNDSRVLGVARASLPPSSCRRGRRSSGALE